MSRMLALSVLFSLAAGWSLADEPKLPPTANPGAALEEVYTEDCFFEGPTWDPAGKKLYFTSFANRKTRILRLDQPGKATVWADNTEGINGTCLSIEGRLLGAQAYGHRVIDYGFGADGPEKPETLLFDKTLNQPNDVCQAPNGDIYFSDPDFAKHETSGVYLLKDGKATKVLDDMPVPNGVITSLDGKTLYVSDSHERHWRSYPIQEDGTLGEGKVFFDPDTEDRREPDGMSIDEEGNLYVSGRGGVWVISPKGEGLGLIAIPEFCSNVCFGGEEGRTLYMTCQSKVYSLAMQVRGGDFKRDEAAAAPLPPTVEDGAELVQVFRGEHFLEGPAWDPGTGQLYFTQHTGEENHLLRLNKPGDASIWMDKTEGIGGQFAWTDGRMYATQAYGHRLLTYRVTPEGPQDLRVLLENTSWNQPNDLCFTPRGDIYFTDPDFKNHKTSAVYRYADGKVTKVLDDMSVTNGIIASLDGKTLYVSDSDRKHWRAYPILEDGSVGEGKLFFDPGTADQSDPDGMTIDEQGNVYGTGRGGVWVISPEGKGLGFIPTPVFVSNVTFGGEDGKTLYFVGDKQAFSLRMKVKGGYWLGGE